MPSDSESFLSSEDENNEDKDEVMKEPEYQPRRQQRLQEMEYVSSIISCYCKPNEKRFDTLKVFAFIGFFPMDNLGIKCRAKWILEKQSVRFV
jgi:hypothetical protein